MKIKLIVIDFVCALFHIERRGIFETKEGYRAVCSVCGWPFDSKTDNNHHIISYQFYNSKNETIRALYAQGWKYNPWISNDSCWTNHVECKSCYRENNELW